MTHETWRDINRVELRGRLGRDPETRTLQNGSQKLSLSVATSEKWKDKRSGEMKERTVWHRVETFAEPLINAAANMRKGDRVHITGGVITQREYTDASGATKTAYEITLPPWETTLALVPDDRQPARAPSRAAAVARGGDDDEIPF